MDEYRIQATRVADSVGPNLVRIVTIEMTYPRFIHSELMTHRAFSRNAASSRAIPVSKMMERVEKNPAMPVHWGTNKPGMQAGVQLEGDELAKVQQIWLEARNYALSSVAELNYFGLHKQVANRLLEPWAWMKTIVTATDWGNFIALRCHEDAQPEFKVLADLVRIVLNKSASEPLFEGDWHTPYVSKDERNDIGVETAILVSVARCARVSYLNHDGTRDINQDLKLYERLLGGSGGAGHWSPFEHVAQAVQDPHLRSGNFTGWLQYRKTFANECAPDPAYPEEY